MDNSFPVILVPYTNCDIHICGTCKSHFYTLDNFMNHKHHECQFKKLPGNDQIIDTILPEKNYTQLQFDKPVMIRNELVTMKDKFCTDENSNDTKPNKLSTETLPNRTYAIKTKRSNKNEDNADKDKIRYNCQQCQYSTLLKKDLDRHVRIHTGERPFKCNECGKAFTRNDKLLGHKRIHDNDKKFKCEDCDYATVDGTCLTKHRRIHTGVKPYKCQVCEYRSRSHSQLVVHLRRHTGDAPYVCSSESCKSAFRTTTDLKRHSATHLAVKPHACQHCPYRATLKSGLTSHMRLQHPNGEDGVTKQHTCLVCSINFSTALKHRNHVKRHHEVARVVAAPRTSQTRTKRGTSGLRKSHACDECEASFVTPANLDLHKAQHKKKRQLSANNEKESTSKGVQLFDTELSLSPRTYLDCSQPDSNIRTVEMLASLAGDDVTSPTTRGFSVMSPDFFSSQDLSAHFLLAES